MHATPPQQGADQGKESLNLEGNYYARYWWSPALSPTRGKGSTGKRDWWSTMVYIAAGH